MRGRRSQVRCRGGAMLKSMDRYSLVWQSSLTHKQKVHRYFSLVVAKVVWCVHQLTLLPADFAYLEYVHARCLRRILRTRAAFWSCISNADISREAAAPTMTSLIRKRQFIVLGKHLRKNRRPLRPPRLLRAWIGSQTKITLWHPPPRRAPQDGLGRDFTAHL